MSYVAVIRAASGRADKTVAITLSILFAIATMSLIGPAADTMVDPVDGGDGHGRYE